MNGDALHDALVDRLEAENDELRERCRQLETLLAPMLRLPVEWGLTKSEARVFAILLGRDVAGKEHILHGLYAVGVRGGAADGGAQAKIIEVFVHNIRRKLIPFGIAIETIWGVGYRLPAAVRSQLIRETSMRREIAA